MTPRIPEYEELLTNNRIWLQRTRGIGVISGEAATALGLCGPPLRGSGVYRDVRKDEPYAAYDEFAFDVPLGTNGDTYDRYLIPVGGVPAVALHHPPSGRRVARRPRDGQGAAAHQAEGG